MFIRCLGRNFASGPDGISYMVLHGCGPSICSCSVLTTRDLRVRCPQIEGFHMSLQFSNLVISLSILLSLNLSLLLSSKLLEAHYRRLMKCNSAFADYLSKALSAVNIFVDNLFFSVVKNGKYIHIDPREQYQ